MGNPKWLIAQQMVGSACLGRIWLQYDGPFLEYPTLSTLTFDQLYIFWERERVRDRKRKKSEREIIGLQEREMGQPELQPEFEKLKRLSFLFLTTLLEMKGSNRTTRWCWSSPCHHFYQEITRKPPIEGKFSLWFEETTRKPPIKGKFLPWFGSILPKLGHTLAWVLSLTATYHFKIWLAMTIRNCWFGCKQPLEFLRLLSLIHCRGCASKLTTWNIYSDLFSHRRMNFGHRCWQGHIGNFIKFDGNFIIFDFCRNFGNFKLEDKN